MNPQNRTRYELTLMAKIAQQTERYDEMARFCQRLLIQEDELTSAERNLCSSAYKNLISNRRAELRVLDSIKDKAKTTESKDILTVIKKYRKNVENQLRECCENVLKIIQKQIIQSKSKIKSIEAKVFYYKMAADFYRYLCQIDNNQRDLQAATKYYEEADNYARSNLPPTNEVRVSLHLNMSVFLYERCGEVERALELANRAFDEAVANVNETNEESFKNCTMILQLIRDNINLWNGEGDD